MSDKINYRKVLREFTGADCSDALFQLLNRLFFEGILPPADVRFAPLRTQWDRPDALINGDFIPTPQDGTRPQIRLDPESIRRTSQMGGWEQTFFTLCSCMLHEMVHYYCWLNGLRDVNRRREYHTEVFRDTADAHGLEARRSLYRPAEDGYNFTVLKRSSETAIRNALPRNSK